MQTRTIMLKDGRRAWVTTENGVVCGLKRWSETDVYSTNGGYAYVPHPSAQGSGTLIKQAGAVRSNISQRTEFWVRFDEGREVRFTEPFEVCDGHIVRLVTSGMEGKPGQPVRFVNVATGKQYDIRGDGALVSEYIAPYTKKGRRRGLLISAPFWLLLAYFSWQFLIESRHADTGGGLFIMLLLALVAWLVYRAFHYNEGNLLKALRRQVLSATN